MGSSDAASINDYWIEGGGSDGELRCAIEGFCDIETAVASGIGVDEAYGDVSVLEQSTSRKRARDQPSTGPKSKARCEKMRRDRLNDRFLELGAILDPGRPPKLDRGSILSDATRVLLHLKTEVQELKESNENLQETIRDLKVEKNELRDEKVKLKADKERLERQVESTSLPPASFLPYSIPFPPFAPAAFHPCIPAPANKAAPYPAPFAGMTMCQLLPPSLMDTSQDSKLWPPHA